jgi:hypothetical protein
MMGTVVQTPSADMDHPGFAVAMWVEWPSGKTLEN